MQKKALNFFLHLIYYGTNKSGKVLVKKITENGTVRNIIFRSFQSIYALHLWQYFESVPQKSSAFTS
jgi:hypothetical protein